MNEALTTIRVSKETRQKLAKYGCKEDTYDRIIQKILESKEVC